MFRPGRRGLFGSIFAHGLVILAMFLALRGYGGGGSGVSMIPVQLVAGGQSGGAQAPAAGAAAQAPAAAEAPAEKEDACLLVRRDGAEVGVTCLSGLASMILPSGKVELRAGNVVNFTGASLPQPSKTVAPEKAASWREGVVEFSDTPLREVVQELNRYRRSPILVLDEDLAAERVSGVFHVQKGDTAPFEIANAMNARATPLPGGAVLLH